MVELQAYGINLVGEEGSARDEGDLDTAIPSLVVGTLVATGGRQITRLENRVRPSVPKEHPQPYGKPPVAALTWPALRPPPLRTGPPCSGVWTTSSR